MKKWAEISFMKLSTLWIPPSVFLAKFMRNKTYLQYIENQYFIKYIELNI